MAEYGISAESTPLATKAAEVAYHHYDLPVRLHQRNSLFLN